MPLYLTEAEVGELLTPADATEAVEGCFRRLADAEDVLAAGGSLRVFGGDPDAAAVTHQILLARAPAVGERWQERDREEVAALEQIWNTEPGIGGNEGNDERAGTVWLPRSASL